MASRPFTTAALAAGIAVVALIAPNTSSAQGAMRLTSTSFGSGQPIPAQFSCEGQGVSPELTWANVPQNAQSLALVVRDPDASQAGFVHWVVYDIPVTTSSLRE
ncbi:MAG TPA: YbhB/YbcL family Raf kinase inhibitor-like protein, partial [Polyangiaceae bacterium]